MGPNSPGRVDQGHMPPPDGPQYNRARKDSVPRPIHSSCCTGGPVYASIGVSPPARLLSPPAGADADVEGAAGPGATGSVQCECQLALSESVTGIRAYSRVCLPWRARREGCFRTRSMHSMSSFWQRLHGRTVSQVFLTSWQWTHYDDCALAPRRSRRRDVVRHS